MVSYSATLINSSNDCSTFLYILPDKDCYILLNWPLYYFEMNILMPGNSISQNSTLSDTHMDILAFSSVSMVYILWYFPYLCLSYWTKYLIGSIEEDLVPFIQLNNICHSLGVFRPLTFNVIFDMVGFKFTILLFVFYLPCLLFISFCLFFCYLLN